MADLRGKNAARILGFAGLAPALACLAGVFIGGGEWRYLSLAAGFGYAAVIFSFLGGMWWGLAAGSGVVGQPDDGQLGYDGGADAGGGSGAVTWVLVVAVVPSLIAFALYLPWIFGLAWPGPSLVLLGIAIAASPLVDRRLAAHGLVPEWWLALRWPLSLGLGLATLAMGLAEQV